MVNFFLEAFERSLIELLIGPNELEARLVYMKNSTPALNWAEFRVGSELQISPKTNFQVDLEPV